MFFVPALAGVVFMMPSLFMADAAGGDHGAYALTFLWIAVILLAAKLSSLIERWGQPSVLGELLVGVLLGNLALVGITIFEPIALDPIILFLAELGVVVLLFQIGLESNLSTMKKVGVPAIMVAILGAVVPFVLGAWVVGPWLLPDQTFNTYLFLGAALTATSVGITARVFKDLGKLQSKESQIVLGAAVIDDILGLIVLAVISALVTIGVITAGTVGWIVFKSVAFLAGALILGHLFAPKIGLWFSKIHTGVGMKFALAFSFGLIFAFIASEMGLAPIVGAFAAGLVLDSVCFRYFRKPEVVEEIDEALADLHANERTRSRIGGILNHRAAHHVEDLLEPIAHFVVPIFFVVTGMMVDLSTLADPAILLTALGITVLAFFGKMIAGIVAGKGVNKWIVGIGMSPRGEVGLIFATIGAGLGVVTGSVFSVIIIMVIMTTLLTPPILTWLINKQKAEEAKA